MRLSFAVKLALVIGFAATVALIAATKAIDFERYKGFVTDLVRAETGRELHFGGPVRLRLGFVPSLIAENVTLSNVANGSRAEMVKIDRIEAEVALPALLRKEILIQRLIVSSPDIILEKGNWALIDGTRPRGDGTRTRFDLRELKVKNARVTWVDGTGKAETVAIHKLQLLPEQANNGAIGMSMVGDAMGKYFEFAGKLGNLGAALAGKPWPISVKGSAPGVILAVDGVIGNVAAVAGLDLKVNFQTDELAEFLRQSGHGGHGVNPIGPIGPMRLSARITDAGGPIGLTEIDASAGRRDGLFLGLKGTIKDIMAAEGVEASVVAEGDSLAHLGRLSGDDLPALGPMRVIATLRDAKGVWTLSDVKAVVGGSDLAGEISLHPGKKPQIKASLSANRLAVADFQPKATAGATPAPPSRLIPERALPLELLRGAEADLTLKVEHLVMGGQTFGAVGLQAVLQKGVLEVPEIRAILAGGNINGTMRLDARPKQPVASVTVDGANVDFGRVLRDGGMDLLTGGSGMIRVDLKGRGDSLQALMASASGTALLSVGAGEIRNGTFVWGSGDLLTMALSALDPLAHAQQTSHLSCAVIHFRVKGGLAATDRGIAVETDAADVVGAGTVSLRDETLDLGFTPRAKEGLGLSMGSELAGMTRLRGTLAQPSLGIDELGTARQALSVGAAAATGGLSLLGELLLDKATADSNPCRTALAMGATGKHGRSMLENLFGR